MHKYESYGNWEDCSEYWSEAKENDLIEFTNEPVDEKLCQSIISNKETYHDEKDKNTIVINKIKLYTKYHTYILNKNYLHKNCIFHKFNEIKIYGKYNEHN